MASTRIIKSSFDTLSPCTFAQVMEKDQTMDQAAKNYITRVNGAKQNGFEGIGFFAAAVVAGNLAGLPEKQLYGLGAGYLVSRVLYTAHYIVNTNPKLAVLRSLLWQAGVWQVIALYALSAIN
ncbi:hypothetical protein HYALB_00002156 [Hymenoscyphus albidus]|uniref:Uncharacterized protein n=1 Tax=Hymenoscyphus albidus TaxID=595503 RepID=A0A9N9LJL5_9HELO|nr:hypothetical protein HYALB_00002156 [Hymenoscyphus albidus]